jgi:hypothetical protein
MSERPYVILNVAMSEDTRFMEQHDHPIVEGMTPEQITALHQIDSLRTEG